MPSDAAGAGRGEAAGAGRGESPGRAAPTITLAEVVERTGIPASTIHHYRRAGLIDPVPTSDGSRFCYYERHVEALGLIRLLRERRGLRLEEIAEVLPELLELPPDQREVGSCPDLPVEAPGVRRRLLDAAIEAFDVRSYAEVAVGEVAEAAGVAKGSVYRHFSSKEDLFTAVIEDLMEDTAGRFAAEVASLGGPVGLVEDPERAATAFALLVARSMPILLELGARAAKGHDPSQLLARRVLRTLADAAGRPLAPADPIPAGLRVIEAAFSTVLGWAVGQDWPPDELT